MRREAERSDRGYLRSQPVVVCGQWAIHRRLDHARAYGRPAEGAHALQIELAMRGYLRPPPWDAVPIQQTSRAVLEACLAFARF
jgi:hypothetical protein